MKGKDKICLNCTHCPCDWLIEQVKEYEAPSIAYTGGCERWEKTLRRELSG